MFNMWKIKDWILGWFEGLWLVKSKTCCVCKHFVWFHSSAGLCDAKKVRVDSKMIDCMDTCDCGYFKKKKHR